MEVPVHEAQGESQLTQAPFLITNPVGQVLTQFPLYNAALVAQDVQLEAVPLQVAHTASQGSHTLVLALATEVLLGQVVTHPVKYRYLPVIHDRQDVCDLQVTQGVTQLTHSVGLWLESGYIPLSQLAKHVPAADVLFK